MLGKRIQSRCDAYVIVDSLEIVSTALVTILREHLFAVVDRNILFCDLVVLTHADPFAVLQDTDDFGAAMFFNGGFDLAGMYRFAQRQGSYAQQQAQQPHQREQAYEKLLRQHLHEQRMHRSSQWENYSTNEAYNGGAGTSGFYYSSPGQSGSARPRTRPHPSSSAQSVKKPSQPTLGHLRCLGLSNVPVNAAELKQAYLNSAKQSHPDTRVGLGCDGGAAFRAVQEAYAYLRVLV